MLKVIPSALCPSSAVLSEIALCGLYHLAFSPLVQDFDLATYGIQGSSPIQCRDADAFLIFIPQCIQTVFLNSEYLDGVEWFAFVGVMFIGKYQGYGKTRSRMNWAFANACTIAIVCYVKYRCIRKVGPIRWWFPQSWATIASFSLCVSSKNWWLNVCIHLILYLRRRDRVATVNLRCRFCIYINKIFGFEAHRQWPYEISF